MLRVILLILLVLAPASSLAAQERSVQVALMAGVSEYDLSGVDSGPIFALRASVAPTSHLLLEGSLSRLDTDQQFGGTTLWIPEFQGQLQAVVGPLRPYLGVGAGAAIDVPDADDTGTDVEFAPSVAAGARVWLTPRLIARAEGRIHAIGADFAGTVSELTAGLGIAF